MRMHIIIVTLARMVVDSQLVSSLAHTFTFACNLAPLIPHVLDVQVRNATILQLVWTGKHVGLKSAS